MEENPSLYLLSLTRGRLVAVGLIVFGLFTLFFFIGLAVGVKSGEATRPGALSTLSNALPEGVSELSLPDGSSPEKLAKQDGIPERPLPFSRSNSARNFPPTRSGEQVSSSALLAMDNPDGVAKKPTFQRSSEPTVSKSSPGDHFYLQLISTSDKAKAEKMVASLKEKNYRSYWRQKTEPGSKPLYMVRVGPYDNKSKATVDLTAFRDKGYKDSYMVILRSGKTDAPPSPANTAAR